MWDGRQAGSSVQRPCQVQHSSWLWQGEGVPGPGVLHASAPSSLPCPCLACSIEWKSRAMPGPARRELWCRQDPFSGRKRGAALKCHACCHGGSAASPSGLGWLCSLRLALPQPLQSLSLLLHIPCSRRACHPPSAGNSCSGQAFAPWPQGLLRVVSSQAASFSPQALAAPWASAHQWAPAGCVQGGADPNPAHSSLRQLLLSLQMLRRGQGLSLELQQAGGQAGRQAGVRSEASLPGRGWCSLALWGLCLPWAPGSLGSRGRALWRRAFRARVGPGHGERGALPGGGASRPPPRKESRTARVAGAAAAGRGGSPGVPR